MSMHTGPRERRVLLGYGPGSEPTRDTPPQLTVSPRTPSGLLTGSLGIVLFADGPDSTPSATAPGFTLTIYRVVPTFGEWAKLVALTGIAFRDQLVLPDIGGGWGLYMVASNFAVIGRVYAGVAELP